MIITDLENCSYELADQSEPTIGFKLLKSKYHVLFIAKKIQS